MDKMQYNNVIDYTLKHDLLAQTTDSLATARAVFNNMGVALPQGDLKTVFETIKTNNYMGWRSCTAQEAQAAADRGTAAIGISEDRIVVLSATDDENPVMKTSSVMSLSENLSENEVNTLSYFSYSCGSSGGDGTGGTYKPTATIIKEGNFNKVLFGSKVWRCINRDMIYNDNDDGTNSIWDIKCKYNFYKHYNESDTIITDSTPKVYTDAEIKFLYAIDPHGVADYIHRFAATKTGLGEVFAYKDRMFKLLYKRDPKYFGRTYDGRLYETENKENLSAVISESESIFGGHPIYDLWTIVDMARIAIDIIVTVFCNSHIISHIYDVAKTVVQVLSTSEADVKREFASPSANTLVAIAFENTNIDWAYKLVSLYDSVDEIAANILARPNYHRQILDYCAYDTNFDVYVKLRNGDRYKVRQICTAINNYNN